MKKIYTLIIVFANLFIGCHNNNNNSDNSSVTTSAKEKKISKRDYSITKQNAYNDLFLDSADVEKYILNNKIADSVARRIRSFYNTRNYQFAWFSSNGLTEQTFGFWSLKNYMGDTSNKIKSLQKTMNSLIADDSLVIDNHDKAVINTELLLTENFIRYTRSNFETGYLKRKEIERFIPYKKEYPLYLTDSLLNKKHKDEKYFADINESYKLLLVELKKYADIAKSGGWPAISQDVKKFKPGAAAPEIIAIKQLLEITGDLPQQDSTDVYNDNLKNGVKNFQTRYGFTANGTLSASLLKEMNVPAIERVKQILINMNRMRWMPQKPGGKLIVVNLPEFILHMYNGK
ncbi:MAG: peptidoglycan-binding protein, partial [Ginsengibacter sp.]